jgi:bla regulator protein BlaR1
MSHSAIAMFNSWSALVCFALARTCLQGGLFILAVWLLCRFAKRMPATARCTLWWVASFKLIAGLLFVGIALPVLPNSPIVNTQTNTAVPTSSLQAAPVSYHADPPSILSHINVAPTASVHTPDMPNAVLDSAWRQQLPSIYTLITAAWLLCVLFLTVLNLVRAHSVRCLLRDAEPCRNEQIPEELSQLCKKFALRRIPSVVQSDDCSTPCITGFLHPVIVLPNSFAAKATDVELRVAIAHELAHWKRGDLWLAAIPATAQALFAFFPTAWKALQEYNAAR